MNSRSVLMLHTIMFLSFVIGSLSSIFLSFYFKEFFTSRFYLLCVVIIPIITIYSWKRMNGCPLTVWENSLRAKEKIGIYNEGCLSHYSRKWFGINLSGNIFEKIIMVIFTFPILAIIFANYF